MTARMCPILPIGNLAVAGKEVGECQRETSRPQSASLVTRPRSSAIRTAAQRRRARRPRRSRSISRPRRSRSNPILVYIEWLDSFGCSPEWQPLDGCKPRALICKSVGWLISDGHDCKLVVPHLTTPHASAKPQGCGDMTIPTKAIIRMVELKEPRRKSP